MADRNDRKDPHELGQRPEALDKTPGAQEDIENASALANREGQHDTTSLRPERARLTGDDAKGRSR